MGFSECPIVKTAADGESDKLRSLRDPLIRYAWMFFKGTKTKKMRMSALYHWAVASYMMGKNRTRTTSLLRKNLKSASDNLKSRGELLIAVYDVTHRGARNVAKIQSLTKSMTTPIGQIVARLMWAQYLTTGITAKGKVDEAYRGILIDATKSAQGLPSRVRQDILAYCLYLWRQAKGPKGGWDSPPIFRDTFDDLVMFEAVGERETLDSFKKRNFSQALNMYQLISSRFEGPVRYNLDMRIIEMANFAYKATKNYQNYLKVLRKVELVYRDKNPLGQDYQKESGAAFREFRRQREAFIAELVQRGQKASTKNSFRRHLIDALIAYRLDVKDESKKATISVDIARFHVLNNQFDAAIDEYLTLLKRSKGEEKAAYTKSAIEVASKKTGWPLLPRFDGRTSAPKSETTALAQLLRIYKILLRNAALPKTKWLAIAQIGLLHLELQQKPLAYRFWTKNLTKPYPLDGESKYRNEIAGMMLAEYSKKKKLGHQKMLARICVTHRIKPISFGTELDAEVLLKEALFILGKRFYEQKKYRKAAQNFSEFTRSFANDRRYEKALFLLASSHKAQSNTYGALKAIAKLIDTSKSAKSYPAALLKGVEWSKKEYPNYAIKFALQYLKQFERTPKAIWVRDTMAQIYLRKKWYGDAARIYKIQCLAPGVSRRKRALAALSYMQLEEREGDPKLAHWGAREVLRYARDPKLRIKALAYQTKYAQLTDDQNMLDGIEQKLLKLNRANPKVASLMRLVRSLISKRNSRLGLRTPTKPKNVGLLKSKKIIYTHYEKALRNRKQLDTICHKKRGRSCRVALTRFKLMMQETLKRIDSYHQPGRVDDSGRLKRYKRKIIRKIKDLSPNSLVH